MVYIYCRVSTKKQEDNYSFSNQKKDGIAFATEKGEPYQFYKDVESGTKASRDGWVKLLTEVGANGVEDDTIWYGSQSRLMRKASEFQSFKNLCVEKKIKVYENRQKKYLDFFRSKGDRIAAGVQSIIDEEEVIEIASRTMDGLAESWDAGLRVHSRTYGYDSSEFDPKTGNKVWRVIGEEAEVIRLGVELYLKGEGIRNIARILNEKGYRDKQGKHFNHDHVNNMVTKSIYAGLTTDSKGNEIKSELYDNIITIDQWRDLQLMVPLRHKKGRDGRAIQHPLTSVLQCASCGIGYEFAPNRKKNRSDYRHKGPKPSECTGRGSVTVPGAEFLVYSAYVWGILNMSEETLMSIKSKLINSDAESDIRRFDSLITDAQKKVDSNQKALDLGENIPYFVKKIGEALSELEHLKEQKKKIIHINEESFEKYRQAIQAYSADNLKEFFRIKDGRFRNGKLKSVIKGVYLPKGNQFTVEYLDGRKRIMTYNPKVDEYSLEKVNVIAMESWDDRTWELFLKAKTTGIAADMFAPQPDDKKKTIFHPAILGLETPSNNNSQVE